MSKLKIGLALCGSFCTYDQTMELAEKLADKYDLTPIMSENSANTDTRFGKAEDFKAKLEALSGKNVIETIVQAEPIGPKGLLDLLIIAPCTGNTLAKLANGITDTSVTMSAKAHLRNNRPVVIAISTNDGLSANAANIGTLLGRKNIYFVPFGQDDPENKTTSLVADLNLAIDTIDAAVKGVQLQPLLL